jgi:hypothetical protein
VAEQRQLLGRALDKLLSYGGDWTMLLDDGSRIVYESGTCDGVFGARSVTSSLGRRIASFVHPDDVALAFDKMAESLSSLNSEVHFEIRAGFKGGPWRKVDVLAVNCFGDPSLNGVILRVRSLNALPAR